MTRGAPNLLIVLALSAALSGCGFIQRCDYDAVTDQLEAYLSRVQPELTLEGYVEFHDQEHANIGYYEALDEMVVDCVYAEFDDADVRVYTMTRVVPIVLSLTRHFAAPADEGAVRYDLPFVQSRVSDLAEALEQLNDTGEQ